MDINNLSSSPPNGRLISPPPIAAGSVPAASPSSDVPQLGRQPKGPAPLIPMFEDLFAHYPRTRFLAMRNDQVFDTARTIIKPGFRSHFVGLYASRLNDGLLPYESGLEHAACNLFEGEPQNRRYRSQPAQLSITIDGRVRKIFPDFLITEMSGRQVFVDVKYHKNTLKDDFLARKAAMAAFVANTGAGYRVVTEVDVDTARARRTRALLAGCMGIVRRPLAEMTWYWLHTLPAGANVKEALQLLRAYPAAQAAIYGWLLDGEIVVDLDGAVDMFATPIELAEQHGRRVSYASA